METVDGKAVGYYGFITCQRVGLADGARADAIPHAVGGEGSHGAARVDGVIHRCGGRSRHDPPTQVPFSNFQVDHDFQPTCNNTIRCQI
jgi:hypothetical protein